MSAFPTITEILSTNERATERVGEILAASLGDLTSAVALCLEGELGAGKTRLVRGLAAGLGIDPQHVASPTFVVSVEHRADDHVRLVHVDAWRLRSVEELAGIGWDELLARSGTVLAVEWPSKIAPALPAERIWVDIEHMDASVRRIRISDHRRDAAARQVLASALSSLDPTPPDPNGACPICKNAVPPTSTTFPFCSSRCRLADLGRWFGGRYTLSRPLESDDELDE